MVNHSRVLDITRILCIVCVVLYHALGFREPSASFTFNNGLFNMLAAFIMPLFMGISGYLTVDKGGKWLARKSLKWAAVAFVFLFVYWGWSRLFPHLMDFGGLDLWPFVVQEVTLGYSGLVTWYLWALVILYGVTGGAESFSRSYPRLPRLAVVWAAVILLNLIPFDTFGMGQAKWFGLYYFAGYSVKWLSMRHDISRGWYALYAGAVAFPIFGWATDWLASFQSLEWGCIGYSVLFAGIVSGHWYTVAMTFIAGALGAAVLPILGRFLALYWHRGIESLAGMVIGVFLLHKMFLGLFDNVALSTVGALAVSMALYQGWRWGRKLLRA